MRCSAVKALPVVKAILVGCSVVKGQTSGHTYTNASAHTVTTPMCATSSQPCAHRCSVDKVMCLNTHTHMCCSHERRFVFHTNVHARAHAHTHTQHTHTDTHMDTRAYVCIQMLVHTPVILLTRHTMSIDMRPDFFSFSNRHETNFWGLSGSLCVKGSFWPFEGP